LEITFLGTGTSQGVPVIGCKCHICTSTDSRNKRLRSSVHIAVNGKSFVIDAGPDFRQQMLRESIEHLDAVILTHEHKDHIGGLDDIRPYNFMTEKPVNIYAEKRVCHALKTREFAYVFAKKKYPGIPQMNLCEITNEPFVAEGVDIIPLRGLHYKLPVLGFRIGNFTYITDMNQISDDELLKAKGSDVFVINALRQSEHISHFILSEALEIIKKVNPKRAFLTHCSHEMPSYTELTNILPDNISPAYDGLKLEIK